MQGRFAQRSVISFFVRTLNASVFLLIAVYLANQLDIECAVAADQPSTKWTAERFDREISTVIASRCLDCHSGQEPKGGLDLSRQDSTRSGGESGPAIVSGKLDDSLLWKRIAAEEMPPENPLPDAERELIRDWIADGAVWGTSPIDPFRVTSAKRAGYDWWSLQPIRRPEVPKNDSDWVRKSIDQFVLNRLNESELKPSQVAANHVIIRRLYFDLIGLPPRPEDIASFEKEAGRNRNAAIRKLVDRLLDSRHFGERWGRHWLDVVRFGESQGFERDKMRSNSWYYRDWVIKALNDDMPYDRFVQLQVAGDVLHPNHPDSVTATGFLVAGPWDEVGQSMRSKAMKAVVRQDEIEDYVGTIGQAFLGLTVNCARCHDHKFDPVRQKEYYRLASAVAGVRHGSREVVSDSNLKQTEEINQNIRKLQDEIARLASTVRNRLLQKSRAVATELPSLASPVARWDFEEDLTDRIGEAHAVQHPDAKIMDGRLVLDGQTGYASTHPIKFDLSEKTLEAWVKLDSLDQRAGAAISVHGTDGVTFDALVYAERDPMQWMAGSDFFKRTKSFQGSAESEANNKFIHVAVVYHADGTIAGYRNGKPYGAPYKTTSPIRFTSGKWYVIFGLRCGGPATERQLRGLLEAAQLYDRALTAEQIEASYECEKAAITHDVVVAAMNDKEKAQRSKLQHSIQTMRKAREHHKPHSIYAVVPNKAEVAHVLLRGNPARPGDEVTPGGVASVSGVRSDFGLASDSSDAERRKQLASWITDSHNPLFARVIVNRLWHYHFASGLVETPNDFGFNGGRPSHPQLLDYLASELIDSGWSLKHVHQLIVTSATYLQSSRYRADCAAVDADNRLLWRKTPMRVEAEVLRDSILAVAGQLNPQFGGPSYQDFKTFSNNSQFYEMIDADSPEVYRRTVYRTWIRSGRNHMLDAFDCPDPSTTTPKRAITTTPIQSLTLMNNSFVLRMADRFAERVKKDAGPDRSAQLNRVYQLAYGRTPNDQDTAVAREFIRRHGLPAFCRVVFNSNEFIYVD